MSSLQILMSLLKHMSTSLSIATSQPQMHSLHFRKITYALVSCPLSLRPGAEPSACEPKEQLEPDVKEHFLETWLSANDDVRYQTLEYLKHTEPYFKELCYVLRHQQTHHVAHSFPRTYFLCSNA
jgi:hypothetical protein